MDLIDIAMTGTMATAAADGWQHVLKRMFDLPVANWAMIGRWVALMPSGIFVHRPIASARPVAGETTVGWTFHYAVGMAYAAAYVAVVRALPESTFSLTSALLFGVATLFAPWLLMQPALGFGLFGRQLPKRWASLFVTATTHMVFGFGLHVGSMTVAALRGATLTIAATSLLGASMSIQAAEVSVSDIPPVADSDYYDNGAPDTAKVELGRLLFFDKVLSGNRNIACATCHHPKHSSSDGVSLTLGEGGSGLGPDRKAGKDQPVFGRLPRNSQSLFNLGAREYVSMFHDGRVEVDSNDTWPSGFWSPAREQLPAGLDSVLAAQAMFPVLSHVEMAGHKGENEVADAIALDHLGGVDGAWDRLAARLRRIPKYVSLFRAAFDDVTIADDITFVHAANSIAAFEATAFRADRSPFDEYLRTGNDGVLTPKARAGMAVFYGKGGCGGCHAGPFQTDQQFHAIAMPQIGPGKGDGADPSYWMETGFPVRLEDRGRYRETFDTQDLYRFRTPSLRNVELTGPWGHAGTYASLETVIRHHLDPVASLEAYSIDEAVLAKPEAVIEKSGSGSSLRFDPVNPKRLTDYRKRDGWVQSNARLRGEIAAANELPARTLTDDEVDQLIAFLHALTDPSSRNRTDLVPETVPSGLPVTD